MVHADHLGASTFIEKGWSKISLGDYEGAEQALRKALELSPNDPQAESLLGWAQMLQDKLDDALLNFQKVLVREPQNALARINVGYICLKKRIFGEAIEHLSRAIRLDNDKKATLYAHFYLGLVYLERDMFEDAQTFFQKTLALGPNLIEAYYELGRAYWFNGQREEAIGGVEGRLRGEQVQSMGKTLRRGAQDRGGRRRSRRGASPRWSARASCCRCGGARGGAGRRPRAPRSRAIHRGVLSRASGRWRTSLLEYSVRDRHVSGIAAAAAACLARDRPEPATFASGSDRARRSGARPSRFRIRGAS